MRLPLKCINYDQKLRGWPQNVEGAPNNVFRDLVVWSRLSSLITMSYKFIKKNVVSTFVERWQPEMNTFRMPFNEITITLDDVGTVLGIPLTGRLVSTDTLLFERAVDLVNSQLGASPEDAHGELSGACGM